MIDLLESVADSVMRWSPAQLVFKTRTHERLAVLAYHGVDDPERFDRQLRYVCGAMRPVSEDEVVNAVAGRRPLPSRAVLITFDDGERNVLDNAVPLMRERGVPGIAFVIAALLDTELPYWWVEAEDLARKGSYRNGQGIRTPEQLVRYLKKVPDENRLALIEDLRARSSKPASPTPQLRRFELSAMESAGIAIGNHTLTHPCLDRCDSSKVQKEILEAHRILLEALGHAPLAFAYPDGAVDDRAVPVLQDAGYELAFLFDHRIGSVTEAHRFAISRVRVNASSRMNRFATIASGLHPALHHFRGRR